MLRTGPGLLAVVVLMGVSLTGCGDDEASSSTTAADATSSSSSASGTISRAAAPTVSGVPATTAVAGQAYSFQPQVANTGAATVSFTIAHPPAWAKFDPTTGLLSGTPAASQVGQYAGIAITLVAGKTSVALPAFSITVATNATASTAPSAVTLSWDPPTENADGTPLVDLKGYTVHYGDASKSYSDSIQVSNPGLTTYVVQNLAAGKYYFAVTAYNSKGEESALSPEVATQVD
jgi:hypothetical protein